MKKIAITLLSVIGLSYSSTYAQFRGDPVPAPEYVLSVTRQDLFAHGTTGHVHSYANMEIKIGSNSLTKNFGPDATTTIDYSFPPILSFPGAPPISRTFKFHFPSPGLTSGYYPLPTTIGGETKILASDAGMTYFPGQYGYGVTVTCIGTRQYKFTSTRFECLWCPPYGPWSGQTNRSGSDKEKPVLYPNPANGYAELEYRASAKEKLTIRVTDIKGKIIIMYTTDLQTGANRLPIDIRNVAGGNYFVGWLSSDGSSGTLKMIKQ